MSKEDILAVQKAAMGRSILRALTGSAESTAEPLVFRVPFKAADPSNLARFSQEDLDAAVAAAVERCAVIAGHFVIVNIKGPHADQISDTARHIAAAIRDSK